MSGPDPTINRHYLRSRGIETPKTFGPNALYRTTPVGYVLLKDDKDAYVPYRFAWDENDRVIYLHRVRRNGTIHPLRLAVAITDETSLGEMLKLRNASRKEGRSPFRPHGVLVAIIAVHVRSRLKDPSHALIMEMLELAMSEHQQGPAKIDRTVGIVKYERLTAEDMKRGGFFYATRRGQVFAYEFNDETGLATLEELYVSEKTPRRIMYLTRHPSTRESSPSYGRGKKPRGPIGPFEHIIRSEAKLTAKDIRELLGLPGRHTT